MILFVALFFVFFNTQITLVSPGDSREALLKHTDFSDMVHNFQSDVV
jgi:hypothetical protein